MLGEILGESGDFNQCEIFVYQQRVLRLLLCINYFHSLKYNTKLLEYLLKAIYFKVLHTTYFDKCGNHQVLKIMDEETAAFCTVA
jgi:hypothetical protein